MKFDPFFPDFNAAQCKCDSFSPVQDIKALPWDFKMRRDEVALIMIDFQNDFMKEGGFGSSLGNDVTRLTSIIPAAQAVLAAARDNGFKVIHTRETHKADLSDLNTSKYLRGIPGKRIGDLSDFGGRLLVAGEYGAEIIDELKPLDDELVIDKPGKGAFWYTNLDQELKKAGITQLIFLGVTTEVCVQTTAREANDRGYELVVVEDAT